MRTRFGLLAALVALLPALGACSADLLGGREKCWPESEPRMAAIMYGALQLAGGARLDSPDGMLPLILVRHTVRRDDDGWPVLVDEAGAVVAAEADSVALWGGIGSDGAMVLCAVEERS